MKSFECLLAPRKPIKWVLVALIWVVVGFFVQVVLPYGDPDVSHGSGSALIADEPLALQGQEVYFQEGCQYCHTRNLRPFAKEIHRFSDPGKYGYFPLSTIGTQATASMEESHTNPSLRGSARLGPDLSRLAGRLSDATIENFLKNTDGEGYQGFHRYGRLFQPEETMDQWDEVFLSWRIRMLMNAGANFSAAYQDSVHGSLDGKTRGDALLAFLKTLGKKQMEFSGTFFGAPSESNQ